MAWSAAWVQGNGLPENGEAAFMKTCQHGGFGYRKNAMASIGPQLIPL